MAEADYEALTEALMQTRRGRWFLTEHARRCREAGHSDLRTALARIEQTLAEPREPAGWAEIQEKLSALPRIEQALADYRDPPAMADLRESLGALARIEQTLAEPREPTGLAELHESLGALARIEQTLAEPREPIGLADLREKVVAFAQTLDSVRAEVTAQRPPEPDPAERARDREREDEMLRLLHEQRERLDALADIWARVPAPTPVAPPVSVTSVAEAVRLPIDERSEPAPIESHTGFAVEKPGIGKPAIVRGPDDQVESAAEQSSILFSAQTPTADLLNQTMIFGPRADASLRSAEVGEAGAVDGSAAVHWTLDAPTEAATDEPTRATNADQIVKAFLQPALPPMETIDRTHQESAPAAHPDPIVQMFIDAEPPVIPADEPNGAERTQLPAWLVGTAAEEPQSVGSIDPDAADRPIDDSPHPADLETILQADVIEDITAFATETRPPAAADAETVATETASFTPPKSKASLAVELESEPGPDLEFGLELQSEPEAEAESAPPSSTEATCSFSSPTAEVTAPIDAPAIAELTLDLLKQALFSDGARADESGPGADSSDLGRNDFSTAALATKSDVLTAVAALRKAFGKADREHDDTDASERVMLDDLLARPSLPFSLRAPETAAPAPADPLGPVYRLSEEERIALFS